MIRDLIEGLSLTYTGLLGASVVAAICATIGVYVVLKRIVFVGASLAQISSAGVALAFLLGQSIPFVARQPLAVSLVVTMIGVLIYSQQTLSRKVPQESIIGIGYLVASALTLMLIVKSPKGLDEIKELLDGHVITIDWSHFYLLAGVALLAGLVHWLCYKQFLFVSFDREVAATQGYRVRLWELLFYLVMGLTISVSIGCAGLLAVFAYMVIPPVTGLLVARRMRTAFVVSVVSAVLSTFLGFCWAIQGDLPTSPPIIAVSALILGVVWVSRRFVRE